MVGAAIKGAIIPPDSAPIPFLYNPAEVTENRSVNWAETDAPGPSHPGIQYVNGKGRKISFTLEAHNPFFWQGRRLPMVLEAYVELLNQLTLPTYVAGELKHGPPTVLLLIGAIARYVKVESLTVVSKQWDQMMLLKHVQIQASFIEVVEASESRQLAW